MNNKTNKLGRHQEVLMVNNFLGRAVSSMEMKMAVNRDNDEKVAIIKRLENIERHINSNGFTTKLNLANVFKDIEEVIEDGYNKCVLQNCLELENSCLNILFDCFEYASKIGGTKNCQPGSDPSRSVNLKNAEGFLLFIDLNDMLKTWQEQHCWLIIANLNVNNEFIKNVMSIISPDNIYKYSETLKSMNDKLLADGMINKSDFNKISRAIKDGIKEEKKLFINKK